MIKLLLVDDEAIERKGLRKLLNNSFEAVEIYEATDGEEAIDMFKQVKPDIIFMDMMMPGLSGIEAIKHIRALDKDVTIVVVSAHESFEFAKKAMDYQTMKYLLKPVKRSEIISLVNELIDNIHQMKVLAMTEKALVDQSEIVQSILEEKLLKHFCGHRISCEEFQRLERHLKLNYESYCLIVDTKPIDISEVRNRMGAVEYTISGKIDLLYIECLGLNKKVEAIESVVSNFNINAVVVDNNHLYEQDVKKMDGLIGIRGALVKEPMIKSALEYIHNHYGGTCSLEQTADHLNLSPQYFTKLFKKHMNCNYVEYVTQYRMIKAKEMLEEKVYPMKYIASSVGYGNVNYFSRVFKKVYGFTPGFYRESQSI